MAISDKRKESMYNYAKKNLKRIPLDVQKEKYEEIKAAAESAGESVNGYIKKQSMNGWNAITYNHYYSRKDVHSWQNVFIPMTIL